MELREVALGDRFDLEVPTVLLNGTQAMVRMILMQSARDHAAGLNTAGYVTGYRGSPLGAVDLTMARAQQQLSAANVLFRPGLNEDLAATALWGSQQAGLRGEGRYDGVFGLWYGKGPGVDRSGDVMRHVNMAGTAPLGGVLMAMGDDHTGESSTTLHQSDWAMMDAYMPILSPAGVQEIMDYGLFGYALSRFSGLWVGLKLVKDTVEATAVVNGDPHRQHFVIPDFAMPEGGLNIRLIDTPQDQEYRVIHYRRHAAEAFGRANRLDRRVLGRAGAKIGLIAAGKNWLDLIHALDLLGIDEAEAERMGITTYKVGMTWPLDARGFSDWAEGLDLIVAIEEKRKLIEVQAKEILFNDRHGRRVFGGTDDRGNILFPTHMALDPVQIAVKLGGILEAEQRATDAVRGRVAQLEASLRSENAPEIAVRKPYFCSGCPHNSSTRLPEGARAYAGIGCHYMVQWMDRDTVGFTQMGGEGANWIGEAPFSTRTHMFQNLGDGTYNHSGVQAIRAALAAETTITYKILFNDAVAMTGGQKNDGGLTADRIARELLAMGVGRVSVVYDDKEDLDLTAFPKGVSLHPRIELDEVQREFEKIYGVSAIIYVQTCAAEKRRRRKTGALDDPDRRLFINTDVCEGCGDCGVQSNCVSLIPVETPFGRKRAIDQSSCNKDYSCLDGFCPSFVTVEGGQVRKQPAKALELPDLPAPVLPTIRGTFNIVITGVGGTGVVTIGALLAMAAHLEGRAAGMIEMAGLAQKGGAVHIHCRLAQRPEDISAVRVAVGEADTLIGGDLVVSAGQKTLSLLREPGPDGTGAVVNSHEIMTGDFTRDPEFRLPGGRLQLALEARLKDGLAMFDASELARVALGDSIFANMILLGAAWQRGLIPLGLDAIQRGIVLNGAAVARNSRAFEIGRWAGADPKAAAAFIARPQDDALGLEARIDLWEAHLRDYQSARLARRFRGLVDPIEDTEIREAVADSYQKLLSYKDEYEVARLLLKTRDQVAEVFEGDVRLTYHLAPPVLGGKGKHGRPGKRAFGPWVVRLFTGLSRLKVLRGTLLDPFGRSTERRMERRLIADFETDMGRVLTQVTPARRAVALELARLPRTIRGFGPVKAEAAAQADLVRRDLLARFDDTGDSPAPEALSAAE